MNRMFDLGVVTDEVSRDLAEALEVSRSWGLSRFELREGRERRFPYFTAGEVSLVEDALRAGAQITAVSPGILKGHVEDEARLRRELDEVLPRAVEMAVRFACPLLIVFGFEQSGEEEQARVQVLRAFEQVAEQAAAAGLAVAIENEPNFWVDRPAETARLLAEIGHPALKVNWDPANLHWGGKVPDFEAVEILKPYLANVHVKDYQPARPEAPWVPVGRGTTPWPDLLAWLAAETDLPHVTLETHCEPLLACSRESLEALREMLTASEGRRAEDA